MVFILFTISECQNLFKYNYEPTWPPQITYFQMMPGRSHMFQDVTIQFIEWCCFRQSILRVQMTQPPSQCTKTLQYSCHSQNIVKNQVILSSVLTSTACFNCLHILKSLSPVLANGLLFTPLNVCYILNKVFVLCSSVVVGFICLTYKNYCSKSKD
jgi:hypothetical protein